MSRREEIHQIDEILNNQDHILAAIKNLNERFTLIENKVKDEHIEDLKNIIEGQALIDEIIVKNSDDIILLKKDKLEVIRKTLISSTLRSRLQMKFANLTIRLKILNLRKMR